MPRAEIPIDYQRRESTASSSDTSSSSASLINLQPINNNNYYEIEQQNSISSDRSSVENNRPDYDLDLDGFINEDDIRRPYLLPVIIPREPTLEELLKRVTGRDDLQNVDTLKLRVISYMISLSRLPVFIPRLQSLNLDGSVLNSLRDLGCGLYHLNTLNVSNCGLSSLDGTSCLTSIHTLIADHNRIETIYPLGNLPLLQKLSLKQNHIRTTENLSFLALCPLIRDIDLEGNPVVNKPTYRKDMRRNIASLEILDGVNIDEDILPESNLPSINNNSSSSSHSCSLEEASSLSEDIEENDNSNIKLDRCKSMENFKTNIRPSTSEGNCHITTREPSNRPGTTGSIRLQRSLTENGPICGSIIGAVRRRKKSAWRDGDNSNSSSLSSTNSESLQEKIFPERLPQEMIDLELGVVGIMNDTLSSRSSQTSTPSPRNQNSLQELARKWRLECSRKRDT